MDPEQLAAAGLYDAAAPDAAGRLELLRFLADTGCTVEEMQRAERRGRLFALAGDRLIRPDRDRYSLAEVAQTTGTDPETVGAVWRALGLVDQGDDSPVASPDDVEAVRSIVGFAGLVGLPGALGLCRVVAGALARVGDAASTSVRGRLPQLAVSLSGSEVVTARTFAAVAADVPQLGRALDTVFRHHLEAARMHFERTDSWDLQADGGIRVGVGFADLSGFTGLTENLTLPQLSGLLTVFEDVAEDVVRRHQGRVVKYIGDAVMFVTGRADEAVEVAAGLVAAADERGMAARAGVATGAVLALEGDYFGPVVNLAARLVGLAQPGEILLTAPVEQQLAAGRAADSRGPHQVRGFTDPIEIFALR